MVRQAAKVLFGLDIKIFVTERSQERRNNVLSEHVIFTVESLEEHVSLVKSTTLFKVPAPGEAVVPKVRVLNVEAADHVRLSR